MSELLPHQIDALNKTVNFNRVAYFYDMGLGKTWIGSHKLVQLNANVNLIIAQKSKVGDWYDHMVNIHKEYSTFNLRNKKELDCFIKCATTNTKLVGICNYELAWHRKELLQLKDFTLMLDESSLIQNDQAKQTKFIMKLKPQNVILLSGTPVSGKYENLWTQAKLLGWNIDRDIYDKTYINYRLTEDDGSGYRHWIVDKNNPYKNIERLKSKLRENGAIFMKTEGVLTLPEQIFSIINIDSTKNYKEFVKNDYTVIDNKEFIGSTSLTKRLYCRMLASSYNENKLQALSDFIHSTNDRIIVFYNFNDELEKISALTDRPASIVNGQIKDLSAYENEDNSVTFIQFQAGAMGLNLQKCNKIFYFSLPERSDLFEQSKKRIHRIGTNTTCFYYIPIADNTIDTKIYKALEQKRDYTDELFKNE